MDLAEPLDFTPEELDKLESFWRESKAQQKEMVRKSWDTEELPLQ